MTIRSSAIRVPWPSWRWSCWPAPFWRPTRPPLRAAARTRPRRARRRPPPRRANPLPLRSSHRPRRPRPRSRRNRSRPRPRRLPRRPSRPNLPRPPRPRRPRTARRRPTRSRESWAGSRTRESRRLPPRSETLRGRSASAARSGSSPSPRRAARPPPRSSPCSKPARAGARWPTSSTCRSARASAGSWAMATEGTRQAPQAPGALTIGPPSSVGLGHNSGSTRTARRLSRRAARMGAGLSFGGGSIVPDQACKGADFMLHSRDARRDDLDDDLFASTDLEISVPKYRIPEREQRPAARLSDRGRRADARRQLAAEPRHVLPDLARAGSPPADGR